MNKVAVGILILLLLTGTVVAQTIVVMSQEENIDRVTLYRSLGNFLLSKGMHESALKAYERGYAIDPTNKYLLNALGHYYKDRNPLLSIDYFSAALDVDPDYEIARNNLALLYFSLSDYSHAITHLEILVESYPNNIHYQYDLAINYANRFRYVTQTYEDLLNAIEHFKIVFAIDPTFEHVADNLPIMLEIQKLALQQVKQ